MVKIIIKLYFLEWKGLKLLFIAPSTEYSPYPIKTISKWDSYVTIKCDIIAPLRYTLDFKMLYISHRCAMLYVFEKAGVKINRHNNLQ